MTQSLPVFQITGGENVCDRRNVRVHYHESKQYAADELVPAHTQRNKHIINIHFGTMKFM